MTCLTTLTQTALTDLDDHTHTLDVPYVSGMSRWVYGQKDPPRHRQGVTVKSKRVPRIRDDPGVALIPRYRTTMRTSQKPRHLPDKKTTEIIDGVSGLLAPTPRRIDLSSLRDVRLELAAVYRLMASNEIESQEGTRRAYVLKTIHDVIVSAELERRIVELERGTSNALSKTSHRN